MSMDVVGKVVVLTGRFSVMTRKQASAALADRGAVISKSVNASTQILFVGEKAGSKKAKAERLGIPIHTEAELMTLLASGSDGAQAVQPASASGSRRQRSIWQPCYASGECAS